MEKEKNIMKIGQLARILDAEYSMLERMRIKKETLKRLGYAFLLYIIIMIFFTILL